jgi:hypothetical protein
MVAPGLTPDSIQQNMVASTWITPGCVQFLENKKRFHTAWVIFDGFIRDCRQVDVRARSFAFGRTPVIQTPKLGARIMRYELADYEWTAIRPMLPNKPRGVPRVNDRRVLNGIFWVLRSGAPWELR